MSYDTNPKHSPQSQKNKCQIHYKLLLDTLLKFFNLILIVSIILIFILILISNQLQNSQTTQQFHTLNHHAKQHIDHYYREIENQMGFISKSIARILDLQYQSYQLKGNLYYKEKSQNTVVQKMLYRTKYKTTGEYVCLGNCTGIQPYLVNLWAKRVQFMSIATIYFKYHDPISNTTSIVYTPADKNDLTQQQISILLSEQFQQQFSHNIASKTLIKIGDQLYMTSKFIYSTKFDPNFQITMAISNRKSEIKRILREDAQMFSYYEYHIYDSFGWIKLSNSQSLPVFAYRADQLIESVSYTSPLTNQTLITFYCKNPQIVIYFSFLKLTLLLPILIFLILFLSIKKIVTNALFKFFKNTQTLISLYQYNIQQIFTGKQPKQTIILNDTTTSDFYQKLSLLPTNQYQPIVHRQKNKIAPKSFIFADALEAIVQKYNEYAKSIFQQKNKEIMNNKFFIHASVNELSQAESTKIKQGFNKARELKMLKRFFKYAYLSLLLNSEEFDRLIEQDSSPLPEEFIIMMREMNRTVCGTQVRRAFKLSPNVLRETEQQLEIRIQVNLLQKYLQILKELDVHNFFAKQLKLESDLSNINQYIENIKHVLNKHNKNIRTLGR